MFERSNVDRELAKLQNKNNKFIQEIIEKKLIIF